MNFQFTENVQLEAIFLFFCPLELTLKPLKPINPFTAVTLLQKQRIKLRNLKLLGIFVSFFALTCKRIFIKTRSIESRCVAGPESILFSGASMRLSVRNCTGWGSHGVQMMMMMMMMMIMMMMS